LHPCTQSSSARQSCSSSIVSPSWLSATCNWNCRLVNACTLLLLIDVHSIRSRVLLSHNSIFCDSWEVGSDKTKSRTSLAFNAFHHRSWILIFANPRETPRWQYISVKIWLLGIYLF
jgi:hypothetical protein